MTLACAFIGTSTRMFAKPNRKAQTASATAGAGKTLVAGKAASRTAESGPETRSVRPVPPTRAGKQARHWHRRDRADASREQNQRKSARRTAKQRLDPRNCDRPCADREPVGEEDRRHANPRAHTRTAL